MKKIIVRVASLLLALVFCAVSFCACSTNDQIIATDGGNNKISVATYSLITSLMKGNVAYYITSKYGDYNSRTFWGTITDGNTQMTYKEYYTYIVDEKVKNYLAALKLFDELGLSLSNEEIAEIDEEMAFFVEYDGDGSKNTLNGILAQYGANFQTLRDYKIINAKMAKLSEHLYGTDASKVGDNVKQDYLEEYYVAFRQILLPTYDYVYIKDKYGDDVYYVTDSNGTIKTASTSDGKSYEVIAYDTENGITIDGENGIDANGNKIYFTADSVEGDDLAIAYLKTGNVSRQIAVDEKGNKLTAEYSASEIAEVKEEAEKILASVKAGDGDAFLDMIEIYDKNYGSVEDETVGEMCYLAIDKDYSGSTTNGEMLEELCKKVSAVEVGGFFLYKSDFGYHIVMRYAPEENAFNESKYSGWFVDANMKFDFNNDVVNHLFMQRLEPYMANIVIDEALKSKVDISTITPNYNFY